MSIEQDAITVWNELKKQNPLFPYRCCKFAVREMHKKGYEIVVGKVKVDNYCNANKAFEIPIHYWNKKGQKNIDITAGQFNIYLKQQLPKIHIWDDSEESIYKAYKLALEPYEVI